MIEALMDIVIEGYYTANAAVDTTASAIVKKYKDATGVKTIKDFKIDMDNKIVTITKKQQTTKSDLDALNGELVALHAGEANDNDALPLSDRFGEFERAMEGSNATPQDITDTRELRDSTAAMYAQYDRDIVAERDIYDTVETVWDYSMVAATTFDVAMTTAAVTAAVVVGTPAAAGGAAAAIVWTSSDFTSDYTYESFDRVFTSVKNGAIVYVASKV